VPGRDGSVDVTGRRVDQPRTPKHGYTEPYTWTNGTGSQMYEPWLLHHFIERDIADCEAKALRRSADAPDGWRKAAGVGYCRGVGPLYNATIYEVPDNAHEFSGRAWVRDQPDHSQRIAELVAHIRPLWRKAGKSVHRAPAASAQTVILDGDHWFDKAQVYRRLFGWSD